MFISADQTAATFGPADWVVVAVYLAVLCTIGVVCATRSKARGDREDFFLAGRSMPAWAVSLSLLATMLSAATFIGGPEFSYALDLSYLSQEIGGILAILIVAFLFLPRFYRLGVTSVYELVGQSFGGTARRATSAMFLIGRVFASGARLFMVAIPFAMIAFGDTHPTALQASVVIISIVAAAYTMAGGIRAVIWTDALQAGILFVALVGAIWIAFDRIGLSAGELVTGLQGATQENGSSKLRLLDFSGDPTKTFTLWTALTGWLLFHVAAIGTDQDLAQRLLTCRDAKRGAWAAILGKLLSVPMATMFLVLGLLLFVLYKMPHVVAGTAPLPPDASRDVFVEFILAEMPAGLRGLMIAGLFAAAMSSLDSALSAMAAATMTDFVPAKRAVSNHGWPMRLVVVGWATLLAAFACLCVALHKHSGETLITFALGVMMFAYSGLLAVFLTALLTNRGNGRSALAALITGFACVAAMDPAVWTLCAGAHEYDPENLTLRDYLTRPAMPWRMTIATGLSTAVCISGRRRASLQS